MRLGAIAAVALCLAALPFAAVADGKRLSATIAITGTPGSSAPPPSCSCGGGSATNICTSNPTPVAGDTITATLVCGPGNGKYLSFRSGSAARAGFVAHVNEITTVGGVSSGAFNLTVPNMASDRAQDWHLELYNTAGDFSAAGDHMTVAANRTQVLGNTLPPSAGGDPFVPAHTVTVCPSGCDFAHVQEAIISSYSHAPAWDNVLITVAAADYPFDDSGVTGSSFNHINYDNGPPHLWIKGIIGGSGTDGTAFPHLHGTGPGGTPLVSASIRSIGGGSEVGFLTIDNMEFGPFDGWTIIPNSDHVTLRNIYVHDTAQGLLSSDTPGVDNNHINIYNSHIARNGGNGGNEHNIYVGTGAKVFQFINSISEQVNLGHALKSRALSNTITCSKIMQNADNVYNGSEVIDAPPGYMWTLNNNVFVDSGGNPAWSVDQANDMVRYAYDNNDPFLTNDLNATGNIFLNDASFNLYAFFTLWHGLTSPPYNWTGNKFVYFNSTQMNFGNGGVQQFSGTTSGFPTQSAIVYSSTRNGAPVGKAFDVNLGTLGRTNFVYGGRTAASLPAASYPAYWSDSSIPSVAACTDPVGMVKVP